MICLNILNKRPSFCFISSKIGRGAKSKVSNLAKYRSAVKNTLGHEVERYSLVVPPEQVISWEAKMKSYFDALKKSEQTLKSKGKMPSRTGSLNFSMGLYRSTSLRLLQRGQYKFATLHALYLSTLGRAEQVSFTNIRNKAKLRTFHGLDLRFVFFDEKSHSSLG